MSRIFRKKSKASSKEKLLIQVEKHNEAILRMINLLRISRAKSFDIKEFTNAQGLPSYRCTICLHEMSHEITKVHYPNGKFAYGTYRLKIVRQGAIVKVVNPKAAAVCAKDEQDEDRIWVEADFDKFVLERLKQSA